MPPTSVVHALQARQLLQQLLHAVQVLDLNALLQLMQAMDAPLQSYAMGAQPPAEKTGELLQLAARDALSYVHAISQQAQPSAQELFASYRALIKLSGKDTAHPADLWEQPWPIPHLPAPADTASITPSAELRTQLDQHVLALLQTGNPAFCSTLQQLCLGLSAHAQDATSWQLAAAWLEAVEYGLLDIDIYAKRMASRLLAFYASYAKGTQLPPDVLVRDLLFFCAQATDAAQQRQQSLPPLLQTIYQQCHPVDEWDEADAPSPAPEAAPGFVLETPQAPPSAPALPAFEAAPEIQPAQTLVSGLATQAQLEPDAEFLQQAENLSQQIEAQLALWLSQEAAPTHLPGETATHASELSRLAWAAGCAEIATLAHQLQRCMQRMAADAPMAQRKTCQYAAEEIRRLLHQFAAGFMRRTHPQVIEALYQLYAQLPEPAITLNSPSNPAPELVEQAPEALETEATEAPPAPTAPTAEPVSEPPLAADTATASEPVPVAAAPVLDAMHFSVFEEEMLALWPKLQSALKHWIKQPQEQAARQIVLRSLHTLKGSARLAGAMAWASQVHALEGLALDAPLEEGPRGPASLPAPIEALRIAFVALQQEMNERYPERQLSHLQQQPLDVVARHAQALWHSQDNSQQALTASQMSLQEIASGLQKLRAQIQDCAAWADTLMLHGDVDLPYEWHEELHDLVHALNDCTDDLGTAQQQLQQSMGDAQQALSSQASHLRALQHTLLYTRLLPLTHIQDRLTACVQQAAQDCGKSVQLYWQGADTVMERSVQEALTPALEHLLRNSVAHGIEAPAQRQAAKKAETGKILIRLHTAGLQQVLSLFDDGTGLNPEAIREKAVQMGLISADEPVDHARAAALILQPGLSTASSLTEVAGRGIGMDAVADIVRELGGTLHITSTPGKGCRMDISLPAPPQVEQVLALRAGSWRVTIPARSVEAVRRIPVAAADQALAHGMLQDQGSAPVPVYWAGAVWQQSARSLESPLDGQRHLLIVRGDTARWGLVVDEVLGMQEVVLQPPAHLEVPVPGLMGTATMPSGHVLQVYEPSPVLMAHEARLLTQPEEATTLDTQEPERPLVLLADDSMSVRRLAQHLLQTHGYRMVTATDGLEALQLLEDGERPTLLIADVEMPNMDGMELLRRVRNDERFVQLPVLMLTAHTAGPVSQKAISLGAQAFLTKPYSPNELLAQVRRYSKRTDI